MEPRTCEGVPIGANWKDRHDADPNADDYLCAACRAKMHEAEAREPKDTRTWQLFALLRERGFEHFYPSTMQLRMCGSDPMWLVQLAIDPEGEVWAWYHSHHPANGRRRGHVSMIYPSRVQTEICFTYGPAAETKRGRGEIVRLRVAPVRPAVHPEGLHYKDDA